MLRRWYVDDDDDDKDGDGDVDDAYLYFDIP